MRKLLFVAAGLSALLGSSQALAQGGPTTIGKQAQDYFEIRNEGTGEVEFSIRKYRGRILVLYFWRTTNQESMLLFPKLVALDKKLRASGVRFISIASDNADRAKKALEERNIEPFAEGYTFYGVGFRFIQEAYGSMSHPEVVVIDPFGNIAWRGDPNDRLEERLIEVSEATKPAAGNAKLLEQRLRRADKFLNESEYGKAYTLARSVWRVTDEEVSSHGAARSLMDKLEGLAGDWLKKAIEEERSGNLEKAAYIVSQIAVRFEDDDKQANNRRRDGQQNNNEQDSRQGVVRDAFNEIGRMNGDRKLKDLIRTATDNARGELLNEQAVEFEELGKYEIAKRLYAQCVEKYKDSPAGKDAKTGLDRIETDRKIRTQLDKIRAEDEARRWMDLAERFAAAEMPEMARTWYEKVLKEHGDTSFAKKAKELLDKLPKAEAKAETKKTEP
ncbi:MAG: redoxin domain-containing protein [Phycisphaerales bacterium]|nr:redoxin domain-containing protein [Phycisphaerales bacterium]